MMPRGGVTPQSLAPDGCIPKKKPLQNERDSVQGGGRQLVQRDLKQASRVWEELGGGKTESVSSVELARGRSGWHKGRCCSLVACPQQQQVMETWFGSLLPFFGVWDVGCQSQRAVAGGDKQGAPGFEAGDAAEFCSASAME